MSDRHDYGPLRTYQVTYRSGSIATVQGHQVLIPSLGAAISSSFLGALATDKRDLLTIHGEFDGHWRLMLAVREELVESVRDVTDVDVWAELGGGGKGGESR